MAEEERPEQDQKIRRLIRWNSADAQAVADQLAQRVRDGIAAGKTVGVVVCLVEEDGKKDERTYTPAFSTLPVEVSLWAAGRIHRRILEVSEEPGVFHIS